MMIKSSQCRTAAESIAAISIIHGIGPQRNVRNRLRGLMRFSSMAFGPSFLSRFAASSWVSPCSILDLNLVSASWIVPVSVGICTPLDASALAPSFLAPSACAASALGALPLEASVFGASGLASAFGASGLASAFGASGLAASAETEASAFCQSLSALPPWRSLNSFIGAIANLVRASLRPIGLGDICFGFVLARSLSNRPGFSHLLRDSSQ